MSRYAPHRSTLHYSFGPGPITWAVKWLIIANAVMFLATMIYNPLVEYNIGIAANIPPGVVDFEGHPNTREHWEFATGPDPYAPALTYHVLARRYTNALVLVKMLPIGSVVDDRSTTVHPLDRAYRVLSANGTLGVRVTEARIRNNDALILIPEVTTGIDD